MDTKVQKILLVSNNLKTILKDHASHHTKKSRRMPRLDNGRYTTFLSTRPQSNHPVHRYHTHTFSISSYKHNKTQHK